MRVIEFGGGLGDIFIDIFSSNIYTQLECIQPGERVQVVLRSANPGVKDLFKWHPRSSQMDIVDVGSGDPWGPQQRKMFGIGEPSPRSQRNGVPVKFYTSPQDHDVFSEVGGRYMVFAISAGVPSVNIPLQIAEEAAEMAISKGLRVVTVGRTYTNVLTNFRTNEKSTIPHEEFRLKGRVGVIDAIDRLSVPGVAMLVQKSTATFCCHSSLMSISWQFRKPMYALYHGMKKREWLEKCGTTWGREFPETKSVCMDDWDLNDFNRFLDHQAK